MSFIYHSLIYQPLYNALILLVKVVPLEDAGIAVILLTLFVRLVLYPLSKKAVMTQVRMQEIAPELNEIKTKYKDNQQEQARLTLELYRSNKINPFSGILVLIIQIPIIWALYRIFLHSGLPKVDMTLLYKFISAPVNISTSFLGLIDISSKSAVLALCAAITTFFQMRLASSNLKPKGDSFGDNLTRSMQTQMKYVFPFLVFFISYKISGVIALYWLTTNLFTIGQEIVVRKKLRASRA
jgi:YidC/Oxa1 family membrane protein insertase